MDPTHLDEKGVMPPSDLGRGLDVPVCGGGRGGQPGAADAVTAGIKLRGDHHPHALTERLEAAQHPGLMGTAAQGRLREASALQDPAG